MTPPIIPQIAAVTVLFGVSLVVLLILRHYLPIRSTPAFYVVPIFFSLWLPAGIILLVPIDLASSATADNEAARGLWLPEGFLLVLWKVTYWLTFALTWFILPVLGEYADSGYREPRDKLLHSIRENAQYHMMVFGAGLVGLAYVFISYGVSLHGLKGLVMALAYCWGLALAIYLMGHGLVSIPRRLLRDASIAGRLRRLQSRAPWTHEQMEDAILNLEDVEAQIAELSRRKVGSASDFGDWIEELAEMAGLPEAQAGVMRAPRASGVDSRVLPTVITEKYLADLTKQLGRARHARARHVNEWNRLVEEAWWTQTILDSAPCKRLRLEPSLAPSLEGALWDRVAILTPYTRYLFYYHVCPHGRVALGVVLSIASAVIVWSEVIKVVFPGLSMIQLSVVHHWTGARSQVGFAGQAIAALWILYMCAAALSSVTEVKVWRGRALVRRNTAHESAFWYASQVARLSIPLSYNFMTLMSPAVYTGTTFYGFLGKLVNLTPLGSWFDTLFPVFVLVPVCATLFGLYGRAKRLFGFGMLDPIEDDEAGDSLVGGFSGSSWREGRDLVERELGGNSTVRRREEAFSRFAAAASVSGRNRTAPILSIPPRNSSPLTPSPVRAEGGSSASSIRRPGPVSLSGVPRPFIGLANGGGGGGGDDDDDESFFSVLGHRMRNTIVGIEAPQWLRNIGHGRRRPGWMGDEDGDPGQGLGAGSGGGGTDFRRWFGGGRGDGRVRL